MKILQRYLTDHLVWLTLLALFVLVALFSFFTLIDELQDVRGNYDVPQVLLYVLLITPRLASELFPIAAVVGAMAALGILAQSSELAVIRTSGISKLKLAIMLGRSGLILVLIALILGEVVAPASEKLAQFRRSIALTNQITTKTKNGFWTRNGDSYINIRKILPGGRAEEIYIYEFDGEGKLRHSIYAQSAHYIDEQWQLRGIRQTTLEDGGALRRNRKQSQWEPLLDPEIINYVITKPKYMTVWGLFDYIGFLKQNAQNTYLYEQALWIKFIKPFSILAMILLAISLVNTNSRLTAVGQRVFIGALIGVVFHICNQTAGHLGVVFEIHPAISVTVPTIALFSIVLLSFRRG